MTTTNSRRAVTPNTWSIDNDGICIAYRYNGKQRPTLCFDPAQAAQLLVSECMNIEEVEGTGNAVQVLVDAGIGDECRPEWITWNDYVDRYGLTQYEAILIAARYERQREMDKILEETSQIPALIESIVTNY
jgi:hypothetical protein